MATRTVAVSDDFYRELTLSETDALQLELYRAAAIINACMCAREILPGEDFDLALGTARDMVSKVRDEIGTKREVVEHD